MARVTVGHVLLGLLSRGHRHGYELKREHDARFPAARPLAYGQVYATLDRLHRQGLVDPVAIERVDGPDRTTYALTPAGRAALDQWLADVESPTPYVDNPTATKGTVALLVGDQATAADYLRRQRAAHLARMRHYTRVVSAPSSPLATVLAADYALGHLDADLRWMDTALDRVAALADEIDPKEPTP